MSCDLFHNTFRIPTARAVWWDYKTSAPYFVTICINNHIPLFGEITNGDMQLNPLGRFAEQCWLEIPNHFPYVSLINAVIMPNHMHGLLILNNAAICDAEVQICDTENVCNNANVETLRATSHGTTSQSTETSETSTEITHNKSTNEILIKETITQEDILRNMLFKEIVFDVNSYDNDKYHRLSYDEKLHDVSLCDETLYHEIDYKETLYHETLRATSVRGEIVKDGVSRQFMKSIVPKKGSLAAVIRSYKSAVTKFAHENNIPFRWQTRYHDHIVRNADEFQRIYKYIEENPLQWSYDTFYRK
jgi:REP element-mobilizing transposase RayT